MHQVQHDGSEAALDDSLAVGGLLVLVDGSPLDLSLAQVAGLRVEAPDQFSDGLHEDLPGPDATDLGHSLAKKESRAPSKFLNGMGPYVARPC